MKSFFDNIVDGPLWIFVADRTLGSDEKNNVESDLNRFFETWNAHGRSVKAQQIWMNDRIVLISADSTKSDVTGCSKDKLSHFFQRIGRTMNVNFFDRLTVPVLSGSEIKFVHWNDINEQVDKGLISASDKFVDLSIGSLQVLRTMGFPEVKDLLVSN